MLDPWWYALFFSTGLLAGFIDSIAGGGGLITLPVLLSCGFDTQSALGTNKLQATFGSGSAAWHYTHARAADLNDCIRGFLLAFVGAGIGTLVVNRLDPYFIKRAIPILLVAVALFVLLKPRLGEQDLHPRMDRVWFDVLFGLGLGFYDGFFGPGTGTFWTMAFMLGMGFNMTRATGYTKVMNLGSNLSSLAIFLWHGNVLFPAGLTMGCGQLVGAQLGSRLVINRGAKLIRPIFISVVLVLALKLLYNAYLKSPAPH